MELRHLRYFLAIAETGSFTHAAHKLHITQPTLSHQIKQFEQGLGAPLFDRVGLKVRLTAKGKVLKTYAEQALNVIESGLTAVADLDGLIHGQLRIGVFHSFATSLLPRALGQFIHDHPGVHVVLRQESRSEMEHDLINGELDFAIGYAPPGSDRIVAEKLFTETFVLAVGDQHPWAGLKRIDVRRLQDQSLVLLTPEHPSRQLIDRYFASKDVAPRVVAEMKPNEAVLAMVRYNALATVLPERIVAGTPGLRIVPFIGPTPTRTAALFWTRDGYRPAAARLAARMIHDAYAPRASTSRQAA
jgi:LysR family cyn operon transcriptional activator